MTAIEFTVFVHLTARPAWLALSRDDRHRVIDEEVAPALADHPQVAVRWYDAEAFNASPSDVLVATTTDLRAWNHLVERLRDTSMWSVPYFDVDAILPTVEDAYVEYEAAGAPRDPRDV